MASEDALSEPDANHQLETMPVLTQSGGAVEAPTANVQLRVASTREQRAAAFRLLYHSYLQSGLGQPNPWAMRVTPYHLVPTTEVFIACLREEVICTMSLVIDGALGIPMESVYPGQVAARRREGLLVGEVSCLADRRKSMHRFFPMFLDLSRFLVQYAWRRGLDQLLVACHPKHSRFYRRLLGFQLIGGQKEYPTVRNRPAVALSLDLVHLAQSNPRAHRIFFDEIIPDEQLAPRPISPVDQAYFRRMIDPSFSSEPSTMDMELEDTAACAS